MLFEHGNLREVVDHERSSCGCPTGPAQVLGPNASPAAIAAAAANPFPLAQSQGLAANPEHAMPAPGTAETQIDTTIAYNAGDAKPIPAATPIKPDDNQPHDLAGAIARFFHKLFHRNSPRNSSKTNKNRSALQSN